MKKRFTEEQISFYSAAGRSGDAGTGDHPEDGGERTDVLPVEEAV